MYFTLVGIYSNVPMSNLKDFYDYNITYRCIGCYRRITLVSKRLYSNGRKN